MLRSGSLTLLDGNPAPTCTIGRHLDRNFTLIWILGLSYPFHGGLGKVHPNCPDVFDARPSTSPQDIFDAGRWWRYDLQDGEGKRSGGSTVHKIGELSKYVR